MTGTKRRAMRGAAVRSLSMAGVLTLCLLAASWLGWLQPLERIGYDLLVLFRGAQPPASDLVIVDFDDASVRALHAFPLPRRLLADVLERISAGKPSVVGLDVLLDLAREKPCDDDETLASAIDKAGNVVLATYLGLDGSKPAEPLPLFLKTNYAGLAFVDLPQDPDASVRRMFLYGRNDPDGDGTGAMLRSFPVEIAGLFSGEDLAPPDKDHGIRFGTVAVPRATTNPDSTLIDFPNSLPAPVVTVAQLLSPGFDPSLFHGKMVLIGQTSEYGRDRQITPVFRFEQSKPGWRLLSGTEVHAAAIETLLRGRTIYPQSTFRVAFWAAVLALLTIQLYLLGSLRPVPAASSTLVLATAVLGVTVWLFVAQRVWVPGLTAGVGMSLALPAGLGYRFIQERRQKALAEAERRQLMGIFGKYVSPEVADRIWQRRDDLVLAGEERVATVVFSDIRSFTALTAGKPSAEVLSWLNRYLVEMSEVITQNGGFLNKFIGDGIMIIFGVPISEGVAEDACRAARASLQMLERVEELNRTRQAGQPEIAIGIGIHTGSLTAGSIGAPDRLEYSVIGETVNLASRLESLTKTFHHPIVMSEPTRAFVESSFDTFTLGESEVRGFEGSLTFYSVRSEIKKEMQP